MKGLCVLFLCGGCIFFSASSVAANCSWKPSVQEGWFDDAGNWNSFPSSASDSVEVAPGENQSCRIFVPTTQALFGKFYTCLADGARVEYVGTNRNGSAASFSMPSLADAQTRAASPLCLRDARGALDSSFVYLNAAATDKALFSWNEPFLAASAAGGSYDVLVAGGALNLYDPEGSANSFDLRVAPYPAHNSVSLVFRNTETRFGTLRQFAKSARSSVTFEQGVHTVHSLLRVACESWPGEKSFFIVSNSASVAALSKFEAGSGMTSAGENRIAAVGGGVLDLSRCLSSFSLSGNTRLSAEDGGTLRIPGASGEVRFGAAASAFPVVIASSGDLSRVIVGKSPDKNYGVLQLGNVAPAAIEISGGTFGGDDCGLDIVLGYGGNKTSGASGSLKMTAGRLNVFGGNAGLDIGGYDAGDVEVCGGEIIAYNIRLGLYGPINPGTVSRFRMTGGLVVCTNNFSLIVNVNDYDNRVSYLQLDGGVLRAHRIYGQKTQILGFKSPGYLDANGGTVCPNKAVGSSSDTFLQGFDAARLGPKGLTIEAAHDITVAQRFENKMDGDAELHGLLRKTGPGKLTLLASGSSQSTLEIASGCVALAEGASLSAAVSVTNGAVFDVSAAPVQTLAALVLGDALTSGRMVVSPSTSITLETAPVCANGEISLSGAFEPGVYPLLKTEAQVSALQIRDWLSMRLAGDGERGLAHNFTVTESGAVTSFNLVVAEAFQPSRVILWPWSAEDAGVDAVATFKAGAAAEIDEAVLIGALAFPEDAENWVVGGEGAFVFADSRGSGLISVSSGSQRVELPIILKEAITVNVESGASLALEMPVFGGGIVKTGGGRLTLSSESVLPLGVETRGGMVAWSGASAAALTSFKLAGASATSPLVVASACDVTASNAVLSGGALIKRGVGRLEISANSGSVKLATGAGVMTGENIPASSALDLGDGTREPTAGYGGFNVFEGEVRLSGSSAQARPTFVCDWQSQIGIRSTNDVLAAPGLVVDNALADFDSGFKTLFIAANAYEGEYSAGASAPYLYVTNHAEMTISGLEVGRMTSGTGVELSPRIVIADRSSLTGTKTLRLNRRARCTVTLSVSGASSFSAGNNTVFCQGPTIAEFSGESSFSGGLSFEKDMNGRWAFRSGSVFRPVSFAQYGVPSDSSLVFDGGFWDAGDGDFDFCLNGGANVKLVAETGGLVLDVPDSATWRMFQKVQGPGAVVKRGGGLLRFERQCVKPQEGSDVTYPDDSRTLSCARGVRIESGSVAFAAGAGSGPVSGPGSVVDSVLSGLVIAAAEGEVTTFSNCVLDGTVRVDFAKLMIDGGKPYPFNVPVARLGGTTEFEAARWRGINMGPHRRAVFRLVGAEVLATVVDTGLLMIVY